MTYLIRCKHKYLTFSKSVLCPNPLMLDVICNESIKSEEANSDKRCRLIHFQKLKSFKISKCTISYFKHTFLACNSP